MTVAKLWEMSPSCTVEVDDGRIFCSVYMGGANVSFKWRLADVAQLVLSGEEPRA